MSTPPNPHTHLDAAWLDEARRTFSLFDRDNDGSITSAELAEVLGQLGRPTSAEEALAMVASVDFDQSGTVELSEFVALLLPQEDSTGNVDTHPELRSVFDDLDRDHNGSVSREELKRALKALGDAREEGELDQLLHSIDTDGDGAISYPEFVKFMLNG